MLPARRSPSGGRGHPGPRRSGQPPTPAPRSGSATGIPMIAAGPKTDFDSLESLRRRHVEENGWELLQEQQLDAPLAVELIFKAHRIDFTRPSREQILRDIGMTPDDVSDLLEQVDRDRRSEYRRTGHRLHGPLRHQPVSPAERHDAGAAAGDVSGAQERTSVSTSARSASSPSPSSSPPRCCSRWSGSTPTTIPSRTRSSRGWGSAWSAS